MATSATRDVITVEAMRRAPLMENVWMAADQGTSDPNATWIVLSAAQEVVSTTLENVTSLPARVHMVVYLVTMVARA